MAVPSLPLPFGTCREKGPGMNVQGRRVKKSPPPMSGRGDGLSGRIFACLAQKGMVPHNQAAERQSAGLPNQHSHRVSGDRLALRADAVTASARNSGRIWTRDGEQDERRRVARGRWRLGSAAHPGWLLAGQQQVPEVTTSTDLRGVTRAPVLTNSRSERGRCGREGGGLSGPNETFPGGGAGGA